MPTDEEQAGAEGMGAKAKRGAGKPIRHLVHQTITRAQRATLGGGTEGQETGTLTARHRSKLGMPRVAATKYARLECPPTRCFSAKERAKAKALAASMIAAD